jgi:hypothetical protein
MGQQQLVLLILTAVVVGMAIVVGIDRFTEGAASANQDEVRDALMTIAARAQGWYRRPVQLGGGGRSFLQIDFDKINFDDSTHTGTFVLSSLQTGSFRVTGFSREDSSWQLTIIVYPDSIQLAP